MIPQAFLSMPFSIPIGTYRLILQVTTHVYDRHDVVAVITGGIFHHQLEKLREKVVVGTWANDEALEVLIMSEQGKFDTTESKFGRVIQPIQGRDDATTYQQLLHDCIFQSLSYSLYHARRLATTTFLIYHSYL